MLLLSKILLTIATLGYSAVPFMVDFNETHVKNPDWDPHARFHVVWQVTSYLFVALLALYLTWGLGDTWSLWLAILIGGAAYGGFWAAVFTRGLYKTELVSKSYAVPAINLGFAKVDANVGAFSVLVAILAVSALLLAGA